MRKKHKMMCLMMAATLSVSGALPLAETTVYAVDEEETKISPSIIDKVAFFEGKLSDGDYFDIEIYIKKIEGMQITDLLDVLKSTDISIREGANDADAYMYWSTFNHPIHGEVIRLGISDVCFTGETAQIEIELWNRAFAAPELIVKEVLELKAEDITLNAASGEAIKIMQETVNVVASETQRLRLTLQNSLKVTSKKGKAKVSIEDKEAAKKISLKTKEIYIPEMLQGGSTDIAINLDIDKTIPRGVYDLGIEIEGVKHIVKLKIDSDFMPPSIQVELDTTETFEEKIPKAVNLVLKNVGHVAAKNVTAKVTGENVVVTNGSNIKYVENIDSNQTVNVPVTLLVTDTSTYTVPLEIELKYIDDEGKEQSSTQVLHLSTKGTLALAQREVTLTTTAEPTETVGIGETFNVAFKMVAPDGAENVTVKVEPTGGIVPKTKSLFVEPKLGANETKNYQVSFVAPEAVETGTYAISMTASYMLNGEAIEQQTYATVFIEKPEVKEEEEDEDEDEGEAKGQPKVIVGQYVTNPVVVKAGEKFVLDIGFLNTHATQAIGNFKANLTIHEEGENGTGSVFTPVGASNTFFIQNIAPGETVKKSIEMYTLPNAKSKTYEVTLEMTYDDEKAQEVKASEYIGIPVEQVTKLEVGDVQMDMVNVGMTSDMTAMIYNTGKTDISNVMISIEGEGFEVQDGKQFEGLFKMGSDMMYRPTLIPQQAGQLQGEIVIAYEDVTGVEQTLRHPFEMQVIEEEFPPDLGMEDSLIMPEEELPETSKGPNGPMLLGGAFGVGIAAGVTKYILRRRRRKLEALAFDEDE